MRFATKKCINARCLPPLFLATADVVTRHTLRAVCMLCLLWLPCVPAWAQTVPEHEKYALLKQRFNRLFVHIGPAPGESIPAGRLYPKRDDETQRRYNTLEFGDATIHLGWYLAVLATENHLLRQHGKPTTQNVYELYHALHALERLDRVSNIAWSYWPQHRNQALYDTAAQRWVPRYPVSTEPDGFLLRDDVPPYFYQKFPAPQVELTSSDFTHHDNPQKYNTQNLGGEESKDQLISMLFGLFFVHRYVATDETYNGIALNEYGRRLTKTMVDFVRYERLNKVGSWKITNPEKNNENPRLGYDPILFSYPLAIMANEIVYGKPFNKHSVLQRLNDWGKGYQNQASLLTKSVFVRLRESKVFLDKNHDWHINYYMIFMLASVSNVWSLDLAYETNSAEILRQRCSDEEAKGWLIYPLINEALYPSKEVPYEPAYVERELALYPAGGAYNYFNTPGDSLGRYSRHWFSSNRFQSSNGHYEGNAAVDCNSYFNGQYNGLDYMLLYNLYRLVYAGETAHTDYKAQP